MEHCLLLLFKIRQPELLRSIEEEIIIEKDIFSRGAVVPRCKNELGDNNSQKTSVIFKIFVWSYTTSSAIFS